MAIHPIDLSAMYVHMDNIGKFNASQNQIAQTLGQASLENALQNEKIKSSTVKETENNGNQSNNVNADGKNSQNTDFEKKSLKNENSDDDKKSEEKIYQIKDPRCGNRVDISG